MSGIRIKTIVFAGNAQLSGYDLTHGKVYEVILSKDDEFFIRNDHDMVCSYPKGWFTVGSWED
jgi:DnaJ-class molecular chaperone